MFLLVFSILFVKIITISSENVTAPLKFINCPEGKNVNKMYILANTDATCQCQKVDSSQTGQVRWYLLTNETVEVPITTADNADDYSVLHFKPTRFLNNQTLQFVCRLENGVSSSVGLLYQPKIAYGPDPGSLTMTPGESSDWNFDLCPGQTKQMIVFCQVPVENVSPVPGLEFTYSRGGISDEIIDTSSNYTNTGTIYRFIRTFRPEIAETYYVTCNVSSKVFPNFNLAVRGTVNVREPPNSMPVVTVSNAGKDYTLANGSSAYVTGNSHVIVRCSVKGGTPEVSNVTIVCGTNRNTERGTSATLEFDTTKTTPTTCTCYASHVSGCYNYQLVVQIAPVYQPSILNFTANSQSDTLTVDRGSEVQLVCQAVGSPTPNISLLRSGNKRLSQVQDLELETSYTNVQCDFTNRYYCVAKNGIESSINLPQKYLDVYVKCLTALKDPGKQNTKIVAKIGTTANIKVKVLGYPAPTSFELTIPGSDFVTKVEQSKYNVAYQAESDDIPTPYGTVTLNIMDIQKNDLITYNLLISNGGQLTFTFKLVEETETDPTIYIAIGVSVGGVLLLVCIIVIVIICCRKKRKENDYITAASIATSTYDTPSAPSVNGNDYIVPGKGAHSIGRSSIASKDLYDILEDGSVANGYQSVRK